MPLVKLIPEYKDDANLALLIGALRVPATLCRQNKGDGMASTWSNRKTLAKPPHDRCDGHDRSNKLFLGMPYVLFI